MPRTTAMDPGIILHDGPTAMRLLQWRASTGLFALLVAALLLRMVAMHTLVLVPEEAYYWTYAQNPSLSYFDHPPMVAWVIASGTFLFGHSELGVRFTGHLMMLAAAALLYLHGRTWYGRRAALLGALAVLVLPVYFATGLIATMDAPLIFFWCAGLLGVSLALKGDRPAGGWYLAGAALGGAMLSKYTGVFLGVGGFAAVLAVPRFRRHLFSPHPYLAALLAMAIFSPVLIWNTRNDWASFRFQFLDRFAGKSIGWENPLQFIAMQLAVATPMILFALVILARRVTRRRRPEPRTIIALAFGLPLLAVMAYKSLRYDIHINWTLPAYLSLMPATAHLALEYARRARASGGRHRTRQDIEWTAVVCLGVNIAILVFALIIQPRLGTISALGPWPELAALIEEHEDRLEEQTGREPLIVADGKYRLASVLAFYRTPIEDHVAAAHFTNSQWLLHGEGLGFEYWQRPADWLGADCIVVDYDWGLAELVEGHFDRVTHIDDPRLAALGYQAAVGHGYRGPNPPGHLLD